MMINDKAHDDNECEYEEEEDDDADDDDDDDKDDDDDDDNDDDDSGGHENGDNNDDDENDDHKLYLELPEHHLPLLRERGLQHEADAGVVAVDVGGTEDEGSDLHHVVLADLQTCVHIQDGRLVILGENPHREEELNLEVDQ